MDDRKVVPNFDGLKEIKSESERLVYTMQGIEKGHRDYMRDIVHADINMLRPRLGIAINKNDPSGNDPRVAVIKKADEVFTKTKEKLRKTITEYIKDLNELQEKYSKEFLESCAEAKEMLYELDKCKAEKCKCQGDIKYEDFINANDTFFKKCKNRMPQELPINEFLFCCKEKGYYSPETVDKFIKDNDERLRSKYPEYFDTRECSICNKKLKTIKLNCSCTICPSCLGPEVAKQADNYAFSADEKGRPKCSFEFKCPMHVETIIPKEKLYTGLKEKEKGLMINIMRVVSLAMFGSKLLFL